MHMVICLGTNPSPFSPQRFDVHENQWFVQPPRWGIPIAHLSCGGEAKGWWVEPHHQLGEATGWWSHVIRWGHHCLCKTSLVVLIHMFWGHFCSNKFRCCSNSWANHCSNHCSNHQKHYVHVRPFCRIEWYHHGINLTWLALSPRLPWQLMAEMALGEAAGSAGPSCVLQGADSRRQSNYHL